MDHKEKQEIFDKYAKSLGFDAWDTLVYSIPVIDLIELTYRACDLVQKEQQKRIADNVNVNSGNGILKSFTYTDEMGNEYGATVDFDSITNTQNLIN